MKRPVYQRAAVILMLICFALAGFAACNPRGETPSSGVSPTGLSTDPTGSDSTDPTGSDSTDPTGSGSTDPTGSGSADPTGTGSAGTTKPGSTGTTKPGSTGTTKPGSTQPSGEEEEEIDWYDDEVYTSPIQAVGNSVSGASRTINIKTSNVVFKDFMGFGANVFPAIFADTGMTATNMTEASVHLEWDRVNVLKLSAVRFMFQPDFMITNINPATDKANWENGVYDYESDLMKGVYRYLDMLKASGTEVELCFGWKVATRIQSWFSISGVNPMNSAPYDLKSFAAAVSDLLRELIVKRGYTNIKYLSFYNEPNNGGDFLTLGDNKAYWVKMVSLVDARLKADGRRGLVEIWGAEEAGFETFTNNAYTKYLYQHGDRYVDAYCFHHYYNNLKYSSNYGNMYNTIAYAVKQFKKPIWVTETYAARLEGNDSVNAAGRYPWRNWDDSYTSMLIALANAGGRGAMMWDLVGSRYWSDPLFMGGTGVDNTPNAWALPNSAAATNTVFAQGYIIGLLNNYVKPYGDVLMVDWQGSDIRASAFKYDNGNYTVVVETSEAYAGGPLNLNFSGNIGKTFNKFAYRLTNWAAMRDANLTIPAKLAGIGATATLTDTLPAGYGTYIYTTYAPVKQIALKNTANSNGVGVANTCAAGGTVQLSADLIDCAAGDSVVWSVLSKAGDRGVTNAVGSISPTGLYTAASTAVSGDQIAVRAALASDPSVYAVGVIYIQ